jgi:hypothetical protein
MSEDKKTWQQEHYERGQKDGSEAGILGEVLDTFFGNLNTTEEYRKGYENGTKNQPKDAHNPFA